MSDKNLLIGDTTYPHLAQSTNENICAQLRELAPDLVKHHTKQIVFAIDRIEQLERELAESKKRTSCGYELTLQLLKITPLYLKKGDFIDRPSMVDCIVEWRKQIDKIDAAIREGKA